MSDLIELLEAAGGAAILVFCYLAWEAMGHRTRHCFRFVYGVMGLGGLSLALVPVVHWVHSVNPAADTYPWLAPAARAAVIMGFAVYLALDRRRIGRTRT